MAEVGSDERVRREDTSRDETRGRKGHGCPETHANERGKDWAAIAFSSAKQGFWYLHAESESVAIQCTLRGEGKVGGKENEKSKGSVLPATDCSASYVESGRCPD
jgi:hypothetical protein